LELGRSEPAEIARIVQLLRALASGRSVAEGLGLPVSKGAPKSGDRLQRVWDAAVMSCPVEHGGEGKTVKEALATAAAAIHVSVAGKQIKLRGEVTFETLEKDWKSPEGKAIRALAKSVYGALNVPPD
jgi:hypothetical protein